jgi:hypothetical protein
LANATIAASHVASQPCVGVGSSWYPKALSMLGPDTLSCAASARRALGGQRDQAANLQHYQRPVA